MAGQLQMPANYIRLTNTPLDVSLTFNTLLEARKYVAGIDNTKGTPYNGQIISVNSICGTTNICGTFKVESSLSYPGIGKFRLVLIEVKRLDNGLTITPSDFIIDGKWLTVFRQTIKYNNNNTVVESTMDENDLLLCNREFAYSILSITDIFCNNDNKLDVIIGKIPSDNHDATWSRVVSNVVALYGKNESLISSNTVNYLFKIKNGVLTDASIREEEFSYNKKLNNWSSFSNEKNATIEVRLNIADYLGRDGVK